MAYDIWTGIMKGLSDHLVYSVCGEIENRSVSHIKEMTSSDLPSLSLVVPRKAYQICKQVKQRNLRNNRHFICGPSNCHQVSHSSSCSLIRENWLLIYFNEWIWRLETMSYEVSNMIERGLSDKFTTFPAREIIESNLCNAATNCVVDCALYLGKQCRRFL